MTKGRGAHGKENRGEQRSFDGRGVSEKNKEGILKERSKKRSSPELDRSPSWSIGRLTNWG